MVVLHLPIHNSLFPIVYLSFFAVLLSLVLDGFDQLIKLFMHCPCCQLTQQHQEKSWQRRDSNPGRRVAELERYRCAMATPRPIVYLLRVLGLVSRMPKTLYSQV